MILSTHRPTRPFTLITSLSHFLMLLGIILSCFFGIFVWLQNDAKSWPTTEGQVSIARVIDAGANPRLEFAYTYSVEGRKHTGRNITFADAEIHVTIFGHPASESSQLTARYSVGSSVTVFYNPTRPDWAVLEPGATRPVVLGLLAGIGLLVLGIFVYFRRPFREIDDLEDYKRYRW